MLIKQVSKEQAVKMMCCGCSDYDAYNEDCSNKYNYNCSHIIDRLKLLIERGYVDKSVLDRMEEKINKVLRKYCR